MSDRDEIYDYIKREINPYGRPFKGVTKAVGFQSVRDCRKTEYISLL